MHNIWNKIKNHVAEYILTFATLVIGALFTNKQFPNFVISFLGIDENKLDKNFLIRVVLILLLLLLSSCTYILIGFCNHNYPRRKYNFLNRYGVFQSKSDKSLFVCSSCLLEKIESPLKYSNLGWQCQRKACEKFIKNPDYKMKTKKQEHDINSILSSTC